MIMAMPRRGLGTSAVRPVSRLDYDFSNADKDKAMSYGVVARTIVLDEMIEKYLSRHPKSVVVNIASGMDTRCYRMQGKYLRWYNVDLPETMEIRAKFLDEKDPVYQIAASAMDESYTDDIICEGEDILVVIEGMKKIMPIYHVIGKLPAVQNFSNKIIVLEKE